MKRISLALLVLYCLASGGCRHDTSHWRVGTQLYRNNKHYGTITAITKDTVTVKTTGKGLDGEPIIVMDETQHLASFGIRTK